MNNMEALIYANIAIWLGFGLYLFYLSRKQANIAKSLKSLTFENEE